ncbi:hypothetical protein KAFR_0E03210 [Kazachstania africana CBS 2517]|uniref:Leucine carboxyl methyltransferase 1 n=1 Tax=Kazachstania africana (strain ATCC 22294 / BCRC 22015 / CBS 2517 / CECT 1963 / NBRC 1671 / NRRL Y-8276) TaxID=1071382 RepID=H2AVS3_KAZAF|nr:hypothetical protein KAFR_0E03210 [Kazachstania africana CBS 2517]CCF58473.1 hypothetical protein KAFR_0E03210 [Kazachstania africana CBS 2517]
MTNLAIQQTDYDAFSSKIAAIQRGYLPPSSKNALNQDYDDADAWLSKLYINFKELHMNYLNVLRSKNRRVYSKINKASLNSFPVMNYGTYLRTAAIDLSVLQYLNDSTFDKFQIVNLGAGSDLRMIQYLNMFPDRLENFVDIDFAEAVQLKQGIINDLGFKNDKYHLLACDLKQDIKKTMETLESRLDLSTPTIIITECMLCYLPETQSQLLIDNCMKSFEKGCWISYDPIGGDQPSDRFGKIMKNNLQESRGLDLPTLLIYSSTEKYLQRWAADNKAESTILDMWQFHNKYISAKEMARLRSLQFLDEIEELKLMQLHYVILQCEWQ